MTGEGPPAPWAFFTRLGYRFDPRFTEANAACMITGDPTFAMLPVERIFKRFTPKPSPMRRRSRRASWPGRAALAEEVNRIVETAFKAGALRIRDPEDCGFMYGWAFEVLDGHLWEYLWMDPVQLATGAHGASRSDQLGAR